MTRESDVAPETPTRRQRIEAAIRVAAAEGAESAAAWEARVLDAIELVNDQWNREQIMQHSHEDNWLLSVRNALLKRFGC